MPSNTVLEEEDKKWLQLLEFIKRKYGEDKAEFIRINDYQKRNGRSICSLK